MTIAELIIGRAVESDIDGILDLQAANQPDQGGVLSAKFSRSVVAELVHSRPIIVARKSSRTVAYLMNSSRKIEETVPIIRAMLQAYPGTTDAYVYGPICVKEEERGKGLAQAMFSELRFLEPGREGILFIRQDNAASLQAHAKMGMNEVATFIYEGTDYVVLSYIG